jgi:hypothetical protein
MVVDAKPGSREPSLVGGGERSGLLEKPNTMESAMGSMGLQDAGTMSGAMTGGFPSPTTYALAKDSREGMNLLATKYSLY